MRWILGLCLGLLICGRVVFAANPKQSNEIILNAVTHLSKLERVTERPALMDRAAAMRCDAPSRGNNTPHSDSYAHVYVTPGGVETIKSGRGTYPIGTLIVKQKFEDPEGKTPTLFTVMRKMEPGYDEEHGDWEYSMVNAAADKILSRGKTDSCIECHVACKQTDYVTRTYIKDRPANNANNPPAR